MVRRQVIGQPSLFGVAATDPGPEDLAGLLAGPGTLRRMGGTVQVSVRVDEAWRVHALLAELARRDLPGGWEPATDPAAADPAAADPAASDPAAGGYMVRTAFTTRLLPLAAAWSAGGGDEVRKRPPPGLHLTGHALRLWVAAAGHGSPDGYLLRLGHGDEASWPALGSALAAAGLAAALLLPGAGSKSGSGPVPGGGPAYRITGRRRLARLAELVGDPLPAAPLDGWPHPPPQST